MTDATEGGAPPSLRLRVVEPGQAPRSLIRDAYPTVIGRDRECEVILQDPLVSRHHAQLDYEADRGVVIRDLGSSNGTHVEERRIAGTEALGLPARIRLGRTIVTVDFWAPATIVVSGALRESEAAVSPPVVASPATPIPIPLVVPPAGIQRVAPAAHAHAPEPVAPEPVAPAAPSTGPIAQAPPRPIVSEPLVSPVINSPAPSILARSRSSAPTPPLPAGPSPQNGTASGTRRLQRWWFGMVGLVAVAGVVVVIATGALSSRGLPSASLARPTVDRSIAPPSVRTASDSVAGSPSTPPAPQGSTPPETQLKFEVKLGGSSISTDITTTTTACARVPGAPGSLAIEYSSTLSETTTFSVAIDDTSASPPRLSKADITIEFSALNETLVVHAADVTALTVDDTGDRATVTMTATTSAGDSLNGSITCNAIRP